MIPAAHSSVQYMHCHGFLKGLLFTVIDATVACVGHLSGGANLVMCHLGLLCL